MMDAYDGHVVKTLEEVRTVGPQDLQVLTSKNATCTHHMPTPQRKGSRVQL